MTKLYQVVFDDEENTNETVYVSGTQFEFNDWDDKGNGVYTAIVDDWAVTSFEQAMNTNSHVVTYREIGE